MLLIQTDVRNAGHAAKEHIGTKNLAQLATLTVGIIGIAQTFLKNKFMH